MPARQKRHLHLLAAPAILAASEAFAAGNSYSTDLVKFITLFGILCGIIASIFLVDYLFRLGHGYVQHHRSCRIKARLTANGHEFPGYASIIGLDGIRFHPMNKLVESNFRALLAGEIYYDYDIDIGDKTYPVFVDGFHGFFAPCYFYDEITRDDLIYLLSLSKIKPSLVPRVGHETTRGTYREEISRRRRKLDALKAAHVQTDLNAASKNRAKLA